MKNIWVFIICLALILMVFWINWKKLSGTRSETSNQSESQIQYLVIIRLKHPGEFGYSDQQEILNTYLLESIGQNWNAGGKWAGKYIEALIKINGDTIELKEKVKLGFEEIK